MSDVAATSASSPYQFLSDNFRENEDKVLEIEILSSEAGSEVLQDGLCIGISKKFLAKAFLEARTIFMRRDKGVPQDVRRPLYHAVYL